MRQIIYFSTAAVPQSAQTIADLLEVSRRRNGNEGVTGLLIAGGNRYLQAIEGEDSTVGATMQRIADDERHTGVYILLDRIVSERSFADWSMAFRDDPKLGEYASFAEIAETFRDEVDEHLRAQVECFSRTFATTPLQPPDPPWPVSDR